MKKYLIAAVLIASFSAPALALGTFYIMFDTTTKHCFMMTSLPHGKSHYKMMGKYSSKDAAHAAMAGMKQCT